MGGERKVIDEDVKAFIEESREILEEVEPQIITLGQLLDRNIPADPETINLIFRAFHTIKGTAAFYQFDTVVSITHKAETLLELFRQKDVELNTSCTDLLCKSCDVVEKLFKNIEETGSDDSDEEDVRTISSRLVGLTNLLAGRGGEQNQPETTTIEDDSGAEAETPETKEDITQKNRLFLTEGRPFFEEVLFFAKKIGKTEEEMTILDADNINNATGNLKILAETADFLEFDHVYQIIESLITLLQTVKENEYQIKKPEINVFVYGCNVIDDLLAIIEKEGNDRGHEDQISAVLEAVKNPESLYISDRFAEKRKKRLSRTSARKNAPEDSATTFTITEGMRLTFLNESAEFLDEIEDVFLSIKSDVTDKDYLAEAFRLLHSFKGSCGFMNYGDLERLAHRTETLVEAALDDVMILDHWDLKAIWFVLGVMRDTLGKIERNQGSKILNIAVLEYMLEYISSFPSEQEKYEEMLLPEIKKDRPTEIVLEPSPYENAGDDYETNPQGPKTGNAPEPEERREKGETRRKPDLEIESEDAIISTQDILSRKLERRDIRVSLDKLDELINLIGELVIAENMVIRNPDVVNREFENFEKASIHLSKIVRDLQDVALSVRMIPISGVFRKMIRLVHDLSVKSKKKVGLKLAGEDTEIDKTVAELIADPLVHLVRNAIDHGIHRKKQRNGSNDGNILLEARHEGGEVWIMIKDDGDGLDIQKILQKGIDAGLVSEENKTIMTDQEIIELIFQPGFSTSDSVTSVSGRGVGMDVVKRNIEKIKGHIDINSRPGIGTTFILRIPLTLAIIDGMLVRVGSASYTIPLLSIRESIQVDAQNVVETMDGQEMVRVREELLPVIRLHQLYNLDSDYQELHEGLLVIIEHQRETACLFIDEIIGEQQTVIKGLSGYMENIRGVSGCTILGDGEVSLILDVAGLIKRTYREDIVFHETIGLPAQQ